jgi:hypothetical protein|tara:strand:+ start:1095 stop:1937 length:843 start_codon:yes stop_codon:yes gene_type:complete
VNILIVGGTGTIGTKLVESLSKKDHHIVLLSRNPKKYSKKFDENVSLVDWNTNNSDLLKDINIVIKLSGESVMQIWTKKIKKRIKSSRVDITKDLKNFLEMNHIKPQMLINASAVGFYARKDAVYSESVDEFSPNGDTFLADVCKLNEESCDIFTKEGIRVINLRIGVVLTKEFYNLVRFVPHLGAKNHFFPWIHIDDVVGFIEFSMTHDIKGPFNLVSPNPITHQDFNSIVIPISFLRNIIPMTEMLEYGYETIPKHTLESGYQFKFVDLKDAISSFKK